MKALILSAGFGTRLRPITNIIPKALVPINGKPLLGYWLENLVDARIDSFLINTHYLSEQIEKYISNSLYKDKITLIYEEQLLNTGGTLLANCSFFDKDEPFMLVHGDNLCFCDFMAFIQSHKNRPIGCEITMMLFNTDNPQSCGIVELDNFGVVCKFYEKVNNPPSNLANAAVYICEPTIFKFLEELNKKEIDFSLDVLPHFVGKINTYLNSTYHRDIGNMQSYGLAQVELFNKYF